MVGLRNRSYYLALVLLGISVLSIALHQSGHLRPVEGFLLQFSTPVAEVTSLLTYRVLEVGRAFQELGSLRDENQRLRQENAELRAKVIAAQEAQIENQALREQLGFKEANPVFDTLPAQIISRDPSNLLDFLIINKGAADGVKDGMVAVSPQGLLGRVILTGSNSAKVLLVTSPSSSVSAVVQSSRAVGMVYGQQGGRLTMRYIPQGEAIAVGDVVITSGLGGAFPKGLVIGKVVKVRQSDVELFQEAEIAPPVNVGRLETLALIRNFAPARLE